MKLLVSGTRKQNARIDVELWLDRWVFLYEKPELVVVGCDPRGVDRQAREWAKKKGYKYKVFYAKWGRYRGAAGPIRNQEMVDFCSRNDFFLGFPIPGSRGTYDCYERALMAQMKCLICKDMRKFVE